MKFNSSIYKVLKLNSFYYLFFYKAINVKYLKKVKYLLKYFNKHIWTSLWKEWNGAEDARYKEKLKWWKNLKI